ncbi:MAG TPA: GNAT family protein [Candidatus Rubrimentiphilum sp.]|nr:GNAT family protein [Candidatus Rubrimentiphilum sp.]
MPWIEPVALDGTHVRLELLSRAHHDHLVAAASDGELWNLHYTTVPEPAGMMAEIDRRLALFESGSMLPFAVIDRATGEAVGMTTYMNIDAENRRLEIGSTWYRKRVQRTALNTECKLLLLSHAFDTLGCIAVEFRTSSLNLQSRRAIERLGAKLDGVLRSHSFHKDGSLRDTVVYSVTAPEWPAVRADLLGNLRCDQSSR